MIKVAIADDHPLVRVGIAEIISKFDGFQVIIQAINGKDLLEQIQLGGKRPEIILVDVSMPIMDGKEAISEITKLYPEIKCIGLSVSSEYEDVYKMIESGACGYLLKESSADIILKTINKVYTEGRDYDYFVVDSIMKFNAFHKIEKQFMAVHKDDILSKREMEFLIQACSELTYKEIADKMNVAPKTVDGYRESVFDKLGLKSRVGLVLYAIENKLVELGKKK